MHAGDYAWSGFVLFIFLFRFFPRSQLFSQLSFAPSTRTLILDMIMADPCRMIPTRPRRWIKANACGKWLRRLCVRCRSWERSCFYRKLRLFCSGDSLCAEVEKIVNMLEIDEGATRQMVGMCRSEAPFNNCVFVWHLNQERPLFLPL